MKPPTDLRRLRAKLELGFWAARQVLAIVWLTAVTAVSIVGLIDGSLQPFRWATIASSWGPSQNVEAIADPPRRSQPRPSSSK